jgi:hypothetical protein
MHSVQLQKTLITLWSSPAVVEISLWMLYLSSSSVCEFVFLLQALQLQSLNVLAFSICNFQLLWSWMQLVQFFIFSFFMSFHMSSSHLINLYNFCFSVLPPCLSNSGGMLSEPAAFSVSVYWLYSIFHYMMVVGFEIGYLYILL